ncbi:spheroidene monooxygenase [Hymenobacter sp. DH14]|uniref:Spheroidene monooxygenase n=1 Tax=Hymenobacter cyanobacteriorum TaxID=2926463 RepID=A0A9X1VFH4_9BACT|nr:spheroidene monooxygenase [Hymenobacter cyanobacteriorum]MCI1187633.1 spheroidene monooxygenase [Hymenobacter cyanobacteriorum]
MSHTTLTVFTLRPGHRRWGLAQMGTSPGPLKKVPGLRFFKLMGSGAANGFGFWPNLDRYGLMAVWEDVAAAEAFFECHPLWAGYRQRSAEQWTVALAPIKAQGLWDGLNPFAEQLATAPYTTTASSAAAPEPPVAVLTRASIRWRKASRFWQFVEPTSAALAQVSGVRAAIGLGELPLVRQATFSVWESARAMQDYAYKDARHREVIQLTRRENWYGEELFARFRVLGSTGTLDGRDPLAGLV